MSIDRLTFVCCDCEEDYEPDFTGDAEERMCYNCLDGEPSDEELLSIEKELEKGDLI